MALTIHTASSRFRRPERVRDAEHVTIYYDPDDYANHLFQPRHRRNS